MRRSRPRWARARRDGDRPWQVAGTVLAVVAVVVALVSLFVHAFAATWQPLIVLAAGSHYPMWAAYVATVAALAVRRWVTAGVAVALSALVLLIQVPPLIGDDPPAHGTPITVLQANLRLGQADPAAVVRLVRDHHVDLLATEELTEPERDRLLAAGLARLLPYDFARASTPGAGNGIGLWSRYPISQQQQRPEFDLKVVTARVALPGGRTLSFVSVHLEPPYPYDPAEWTRELPRLRRLLRGLPGSPVIAAGDFNATTDHRQFRDLLGDGVADGAEQAGAGYLPSYPADRWYGPLIAIDHVLTRDAVATDVDTVDLPNSDHRGLLARVVLDPR